MTAAIGGLVAVQADAAALRAHRGIADDGVRDPVLSQVAVEQPTIERIGFEGHHGFDRRMLSGMQRVPSQIGAYVDENPRLRAREIIIEPAARNRLVRTVFGDVATDQVAMVNEKLQARACRADPECWTPRHQPRGQEHGGTDAARDANHRLPSLITLAQSHSAASCTEPRTSPGLSSQASSQLSTFNDFTNFPTPSVWAHSKPSSMISSSLKCFPRSW